MGRAMRGSGLPLPCVTKPRLSPQHMRGKLLTPSYSHGPLAPCFPAQQSPSHQKLRVLALGRWLLAGLSRELRHPSNVPLVGVEGARWGGEFLVLQQY